MKKVIKVFLMSAVSVVGLFCAVPNAMCKEPKSAPSYYTVKTEKDLRDAVNLSNKGDTIVITGDIELNSTLTIPKDKELTIANDREVRTIKRGNTRETMIQISQGSTLTLKGINGTDEEPSLLIDGNNKHSDPDGRIVTNSGTFNMYTGVSLQNNRIENMYYRYIGGSAVRCSKNSTFNMYGGSINRNGMMAGSGYCYGTIYLDSGSTFNMSGGIISNNTSKTPDPDTNHGIVYCGVSSHLNISGGKLSKNKGGIYCDSNAIVNMTNGSITENSHGIYSLGKFVMSGGSIANNTEGLEIRGEFVLSKDSQIVSNDIFLARDKKIIIDGFISGNNGSFMNISLPECGLSNPIKIIETVNGAKLSDVLDKFRLSNKRYVINSEGYVNDAYQDFEKTDNNTDTKISYCENVLSKDVEVSTTKVNSVSNVKGSKFYIGSLCNIA